MAFDKPLVVIDNGSRYIKAGFSCDDNPVSIFRNTVGRPKYLNGKVGKNYYDVLIGDDAVEQVGDYDLSYPVESGQIVNWDNMERVWFDIFYKQLKVAPEDRSVIIGLSPHTSLKEKYKCCQVMFEILNVPSLCIQPQSVLGLFGEGITTGLCVDLGFDTVDITPVFEGRMITYANIQTGIAASQIMNFVETQLKNKNIYLDLNKDHIIEDLIKNICYVTTDAAVSRKKIDFERKYKLPSGEEIDMGEEAFTVAELLFQPKTVAEAYNIKINTELVKILSIQEAIVTSCSKCDADIRESLYDNIITCGGIATLPGFNVRLAKEIRNISNHSVRLISSPNPYVLPWLGGATFASMNDAHQIWVTKKDFEENGSNCIRQKFS